VRRRTTLVVRLLAVTAALALVLAACGGGGGDEKSKKKAAPKKEAVAPLTGVAPAGESVTRPALEVKINNTTPARPQAGLDVADVVYEEVVETPFTRFLAIFNSTLPDTVGPIRSVRGTDPNIVWPLGGVFAYSGGAAPNIELIRQAPVNAVDETGAGDAMFRDRSRRVVRELTLYGRPAELIAKGGQPVPPRALFQYLEANEQSAGDPAASVHAVLSGDSDPTYTYDAATRTWKRSAGLAPFTAVAGQQIAPTNVIVQFTNYEGGAGSPTAEGVTVGEGEAWVFTDGKIVRGRWVRPAKEQPAQYVDAAGKAIKLLPGKTWVELVPVGAPVEVTAPPPPPPSSAPATTR
jgi:Protein of unknown function (DUF3048) N-terminal domain/Protein of unknown function (DUF3048) C-terminal domain